MQFNRSPDQYATRPCGLTLPEEVRQNVADLWDPAQHSLPGCDTIDSPEAVSFHPSNFFDLSAWDKAAINARVNYLLEADQVTATPAPPVDPASAREQRRDLYRWNKVEHDQLTATLEPAYLGLAARVKAYASDHPEELRRMCSEVRLTEVPYALASLPPTLFDHRDPTQPFIPKTDEEIALLTSEFMHFKRLLARMGGPTVRAHRHSVMGEYLGQSLDLYNDLRRRRDQGDQIFATATGRQQWRQYHRTFTEMASDPTANPMSLNQSATFVAYGKNYRFTTEARFFEKTNGRFESFWLADAHDTTSAFTSQIRTPIGWYGPEAARHLALGTYLMMRLISSDPQFAKEAAAIAQKDPTTRQLLKQHLMRSSDQGLQGNSVEHGIKHTALEATLSVSGLSSAIEADGIPGYRHDLQGGLAAIRRNHVHKLLTRTVPQTVVGSMALYGNYFKYSLITGDGQLRVEPEVAAAWQDMRDRITAVKHAAWAKYLETGEGDPPVRYGLGCPFNGDVVNEFSEALLTCRAVLS